MKKDKLPKSAAVVVAAFIGAFASRYVDKSLSFEFPINVILLLVSGIILIFVVYFLASEFFE